MPVILVGLDNSSTIASDLILLVPGLASIWTSVDIGTWFPTAETKEMVWVVMVWAVTETVVFSTIPAAWAAIWPRHGVLDGR